MLHHVTVDELRDAFMVLKRNAAPGVDGQTWQDYVAGLEGNLQDLHGRVQRGTYRALPVRRRFIPKSGGQQRPLGVTALEDKIVQRAVVAVLNAIYEEDFLGCSYGFRPGRSQHDALDALCVGITATPVNWLLDAVIRSLRERMHDAIPEQGKWLKAVVTGYFAYHAVPTNSRALGAFRYHVTDLGRRIGRESAGVTRTQVEQFIEQAKTDARHRRLNLPAGRKNAKSFKESALAYLKAEQESGGLNLTAKSRHLNMHMIPFFSGKSLADIDMEAIGRYVKNRSRQVAQVGGDRRSGKINSRPCEITQPRRQRPTVAIDRVPSVA